MHSNGLHRHSFCSPPNTFAVFCPALVLSGNSFWSPLSPSPRSGSKENCSRNDNGGRWGYEEKKNEEKGKGWKSHPSYGDEGWGRGGGTGGSGGSGVRK